jgi:hypothetical protein
MIGSVGEPTPEHVAYSRELLDSFPDTVRSAAREPFGAQAIVFSLLLDSDQVIREQQLAHLQRSAEPAIHAETVKLASQIDTLGKAVRLPLLDISLPALRQLSPKQFQSFTRDVQVLVEADNRISLFEFTLLKIIFRHLKPTFQKAEHPRPHYYSINPLANDCCVILSTLAHAGHDDADETERAFNLGVKRLALDQPNKLLPEATCSLAAFDQAMDRVVLGTAGVKGRVLEGCVHCAGADGVITISEAELLRAIADAIDCPMPPILPTAAG